MAFQPELFLIWTAIAKTTAIARQLQLPDDCNCETIAIAKTALVRKLTALSFFIC